MLVSQNENTSGRPDSLVLRRLGMEYRSLTPEERQDFRLPGTIATLAHRSGHVRKLAARRLVLPDHDHLLGLPRLRADGKVAQAVSIQARKDQFATRSAQVESWAKSKEPALIASCQWLTEESRHSHFLPKPSPACQFVTMRLPTPEFV